MNDDLKFAFFVPFEKSKDEENVYFGGIASTTDVDRDGDMISEKALIKGADGLMKNSTVFFNHKHDQLAVGKVTKAWHEGGKLMVKFTPSKAEGVRDIITQINEGILKSLSIGGKVLKAGNQWHDVLKKDVRVIEDIELYEVSVVGLPANPHASLMANIAKAFGKTVVPDAEKEGGENMVEKPVEVPAISEAKPPEKVVEVTQKEPAADSKCESKPIETPTPPKVEQIAVTPEVVQANPMVSFADFKALREEVAEMKASMRMTKKGLSVQEQPADSQDLVKSETKEAKPFSNRDDRFRKTLGL
jgi:HK97 family phage prohead protease